MSKYYDPNDKIVYDGDIAEARDVNDVNTSTAAGFDLVEADINNIGNIGEEWAIEAREWAISPNQPEPGYESSRTYAIESGDSATASAVSAAEAAISEGNALVAEQNAANCAEAARLHAVDAGDKVGDAEQWAISAAQSASAAATSATEADGSATAAAASAVEAETSAQESETEADRSAAGALESYHWANYPEDSAVPESQNPPEYSAYHWMKKAEAIAGGDFVLSVNGLDPIVVDNTDTQNPIITWAGDKTDVGLGNVDNTADANKPVSGPQKTYIDDGDAAVTTAFQQADSNIITNYQAADANLQSQIDALAGGVQGVTGADPITVNNTDPLNPIVGWAGDKTDVGLDNVDNTADIDKPISTQTQLALNNKENFLGNPTQDGQVLASTVAGVRSWVTGGGGGGGGGLVWSLTAVDASVVTLEGKMVDTSAGPITITIPDNPAEGEVVGVMDAFGDAETNNITIASLQFIMGDAENMTIASNNMAVRLVYSGDAQYGWRVETLTPCGGGGGGTGGGGLTWQTAADFDFAAENGNGYPMFGGATMTLPATPEDNDQIGWKDWNNDFDQTPCFIDPNGNNIEQLGSGVMELNTKGQGGTLVWMTDRWLIVDVTEIGTEPEPQGIKSIQHLTGSVGNNETLEVPINTVDMSKTFIVSNWGPLNSGASARYYTLLKDANTVTVSNQANQTNTYAVEVVEFY